MATGTSVEPELDRFRGCVLGLAAGDAVGTTVDFQERGSFPPVNDMLGGGPFSLKAGFWTDDTSMALCQPHPFLFKILDRLQYAPDDRSQRRRSF